MENTLIFANWKSNKTKNEARNWLDSILLEGLPENLEVVILPPFTLLDFVSGYIKEKSLAFKLGSQDVSPFESGAYTGEVSAAQIKEFADYVLIGHSERRSNFSESDEMVQKKIEVAASVGLIPVVCVSNLDQVKSLPEDEIIIAYEPVDAIGTGNPQDPNIVLQMIKDVTKIKNAKVIYGGSVDNNNIKDYLGLENISGALVGGASLDPATFANILKNAV